MSDGVRSDIHFTAMIIRQHSFRFYLFAIEIHQPLVVIIWIWNMCSKEIIIDKKNVFSSASLSETFSLGRETLTLTNTNLLYSIAMTSFKPIHLCCIQCAVGAVCFCFDEDWCWGLSKEQTTVTERHLVVKKWMKALRSVVHRAAHLLRSTSL